MIISKHGVLKTRHDAIDVEKSSKDAEKDDYTSGGIKKHGEKNLKRCLTEGERNKLGEKDIYDLCPKLC